MPEVNRAIVLDCGHKELGFFKRLSLAKKIRGIMIKVLFYQDL